MAGRRRDGRETVMVGCFPLIPFVTPSKHHRNSIVTPSKHHPGNWLAARWQRRGNKPTGGPILRRRQRSPEPDRGTLRAILRQTDIAVEDFIRLL